jgi:HPt (histidine-containing phosphotransfer) domain-containing protein
MLKQYPRVFYPEDTSSSASILPSWAARVVLDEGALSRLRELDPDGKNQLMQRVVTAFDTCLARLMPDLLAKTQTDQHADLNVVRHVAHTLKSSSASLGAMQLANLCAELESMARLGQCEGIVKRIEFFKQEVVAVQYALKRMLDREP